MTSRARATKEASADVPQLRFAAIGAGEVAVLRVLGTILSAATSVILSRLLGSEGIGVYSLTTLVVGVLFPVLTLGLPSAATYYVAKGDYPASDVWKTSRALGLGFAAIGWIAGAVVAWMLRGTVFSEVNIWYVLLGLASLFPMLLSTLFCGVLLGNRRFGWYGLIPVLQGAMQLILLLVFVGALHWYILGALIALIMSQTVSLAVGLLVFRGADFVDPMGRFRWEYACGAIQYGWPVSIAGIIWLLHLRVDRFLLAAWNGPSEVGLYSVSVWLSEALWLVSGATSQVVLPLSARWALDRTVGLTPLAFRAMIFMTGLAAVLGFILSPWFIPVVFSDAFLGSVRPFQLMLPGVVLIAGAQVLSQDLLGRGAVWPNTAVSTGSLVLNLILNTILIPRYGAAGAAAASSLSYVAGAIGTTLVFCNLHRLSPLQLLRPDWNDRRVVRSVARRLVAIFRSG